MTLLDLFSGIGGFSLAATMCDIKTLCFVENNPWCQDLLRLRFPQIPILGDIKNVNGKEIVEKYGKPDIVSGGFPCQPFSFSGKRKGKRDPRYLWPEMLRIIREVLPNWIIVENVIGISNMVLEEMLNDVESEGYERTNPIIIPASSIEADHERGRVWIITHLNQGRLSWGEGENGSKFNSPLLQWINPNSYNQRFQGPFQNRWVGAPVIEEEKKGDEYCGIFSVHRRERWDKPGMGGSIYGVSSGMDRYFRNQFDNSNIPKTTGRIKRRKDRIGGLGNSVIPGLVVIFFSYIKIINDMIERGEI